MIVNKIKLLSGAVIVLFILNFGTLTYLFLSKNGFGPKGRSMPRELVIKKLNFDENQVVAYDKTIKIHQNNIRNLDDSIKETKNKLYQLLNSDVLNTKEQDSLILKIAEYQKQIETTHFNHFLEIKALCKTEQLSDFRNLTDELSRMFSNRRPIKHD